MNTKTLLLDFDGVLFRNARSMQRVVNRSDEFTLMCAPNYDPMRNPKHNYKRYGHTVTMLQQHFGADVDFEDYNDYVFSKSIFANILEDMTVEDWKNAKFWNLTLRELPNRYHIFSNAPACWVETILMMTGLEASFGSGRGIFTSDRLGALKPDARSYETISKRLLTKPDDLVLIDDAWANIEGARAFGMNGILYGDHEDFLSIQGLHLNGEANPASGMAR